MSPPSQPSGMDYFIPAPWKTQDMIERDRPLIAKAKAGCEISAAILWIKYQVRVFTEEELGEHHVQSS